MNPDNIIFEQLFGGLINTEKKDITSYTQEQLNAISNVAIDPAEAYPFGSASYKIQRYPGDLDVRETIVYDGDINSISNDFAVKLQNMVKEIKKQKMVYFSEIKAGFDKRFMIDIGHIENKRIIGYDPKMIRKELRKIGDYPEINDLISLVENNPSLNDWDILGKELREFYIIRWSENDIMNGYTELIGGKRIYLADALRQKTMVKIDTWQYINGRFVEVTNFFIIVNDKNGEIQLVNLPDDFYNRVDGALKDETDKLMCSGVYFKPLKAIKRMWTIAMMRNDQNMLEKLTPIINSGVGILNQVNGDIESLIGILEKSKSIPIASIRKEINNFKGRIAGIYDLSIDIVELNDIFDNLSTMDYIPSLYNRLKMLKKFLQDIINSETIEYLHSVDLYPIPADYLPTNVKYC